MKKNNINNVKIQIDKQMKITSFGGYFIVNKIMKQLGLKELFGTGLGLKVRERNFKEIDYINSVIANLMTKEPDLFGKYNYGFIITNSKESPKLVYETQMMC